MLDKLFKFPIIMVDGDNEEKKEKLALGDSEFDIIEGVAECPYFDFLSVQDAWIPNEESFRNALDNKKFNACRVNFGQSGMYTVPWTRAKFKKEYQAFLDEYNSKNPKDDRQYSIIPIEFFKKDKEEKDEPGTE